MKNTERVLEISSQPNNRTFLHTSLASIRPVFNRFHLVFKRILFDLVGIALSSVDLINNSYSFIQQWLSRPHLSLEREGRPGCKGNPVEEQSVVSPPGS